MQLEWRPGDSSPLNQFFDMSFRWADRGSLSIQHLSRKRSLGDWTGGLDQRVTLSQIATRVPLGNRWSVIGMWSRNHTLDRQVESIAGLELDSCCTRISIADRQYSEHKLSLDPESKTFFFKEQSRRGIFLEVELKGLTLSATASARCCPVHFRILKRGIVQQRCPLSHRGRAGYR